MIFKTKTMIAPRANQLSVCQIFFWRQTFSQHININIYFIRKLFKMKINDKKWSF